MNRDNFLYAFFGMMHIFGIQFLLMAGLLTLEQELIGAFYSFVIGICLSIFGYKGAMRKLKTITKKQFT